MVFHPDDFGKELSFSAYGVNYVVNCIHSTIYKVSLFKISHLSSPVVFPDLSFEIVLVEPEYEDVDKKEIRIYTSALSPDPKDKCKSQSIPNAGYFVTEGKYDHTELLPLFETLKDSTVYTKTKAAITLTNLLRFYEEHINAYIPSSD